MKFNKIKSLCSSLGVVEDIEALVGLEGDSGLTGLKPKFGLGDIFRRFPKIQYNFIR